MDVYIVDNSCNHSCVVVVGAVVVVVVVADLLFDGRDSDGPVLKLYGYSATFVLFRNEKDDAETATATVFRRVMILFWIGSEAIGSTEPPVSTMPVRSDYRHRRHYCGGQHQHHHQHHATWNNRRTRAAAAEVR